MFLRCFSLHCEISCSSISLNENCLFVIFLTNISLSHNLSLPLSLSLSLFLSLPLSLSLFHSLFLSLYPTFSLSLSLYLYSSLSISFDLTLSQPLSFIHILTHIPTILLPYLLLYLCRQHI